MAADGCAILSLYSPRRRAQAIANEELKDVRIIFAFDREGHVFGYPAAGISTVIGNDVRHVIETCDRRAQDVFVVSELLQETDLAAGGGNRDQIILAHL